MVEETDKDRFLIKEGCKNLFLLDYDADIGKDG
jgi:hypothetical protein